MTPGQRRAVAELEAIAQLSGGAIAIRGSVDESDAFVKVPIAVSTQGTRHYPGGLELDPAEDLEIWIAADAPLIPPYLLATDARWSHYPHVTGRLLCLYIDAATQWSPADGMYGFVHRMGEWFVAAAAGELDPDGGPLHPPVELGIGYSPTRLVILGDIPDSEHKRLLWANLEPRTADRIDVTEFHRFGPRATPRLAAVVLSNRSLTGDYAGTFGALSRQLQSLGFGRNSLAKHVMETAQLNPEGTPLVVLVGTLNRRVDRSRFHHLVGWELPAAIADRFRELVTANSQAEVDRALDAAEDWASTEQLAWTHIYEARTSVTRRRDGDSTMSALSGKTIEIWGCGALGGWLAELIARAKPASIRLRDRSTVSPGLVVRQPYDGRDITTAKATALADRLRRIYDGTVLIEDKVGDVNRIEPIAADLGSVDLIVDATANRSVAAAIDRYAATHPDHPLIVSVATDARCELTALFTSPPGGAGPAYTARAALHELKRGSRHGRLTEAFWGAPGIDDLVQPEPGCSAPTFHGSAADAASAASALANQVACCLLEPERRVGWFTALPHADPLPGEYPLTIHVDCPLRVEATGGYTVFLSTEARSTIEALATETFTAQHPVETGGLLFGERDDASLTVTIDTATGPPPDSTHSRSGFERGIEGTDAAVAAVSRTETGRASYLGDWHTHPHGAATLSATDLRATQQRGDGASLILIWAGTPDAPAWTAKVIEPDPTHAASTSPPAAAVPAAALTPTSRPKPGARAALRRCEAPMPPRRSLPPTRPNRPAILVALSGGGFRATLAGLGVLRFLVDAELIQDTRIISSVSGGSLANAVMATNWTEACGQPGFDQRVLTPVVNAIASRSFRADLVRNSWRTARPGSSRTTLLADRLDKRFLNGTRLEDLPAGCWFMFNAANVTEGVRFRFDADVVGDYVNGSIPTTGSEIRVATAVAASAAVPGPFPPIVLDHLEFPCNTGHAVRVADGGVYDNLGLEAIQRERIEFDSSFLLALNAGSLLPADARSGFGRIPIAGKLWRANAVMHRQISALRTRRLFQESETDQGRPFVTFNLATPFPTDLGVEECNRLGDWRALNEEHDQEASETLAAIPTTFASIGHADAHALVQRSWWLTGATLAVYHPWLLRRWPSWKDPA